MFCYSVKIEQDAKMIAEDQLKNHLKHLAEMTEDRRRYAEAVQASFIKQKMG